MKKIIYAWLCVVCLFIPVSVNASFVVEEEVEVSSGEINGNQQPQSSPEEPVQQPQIQNEPGTDTDTSGNSTSGQNKTEYIEKKRQQEKTVSVESVPETAETDVTETVIQETEEQTETEQSITELVIPETEIKEQTVTEVEETEENVTETEVKESRTDLKEEKVIKAELKKVSGMLCILIAVVLGIYLFCGQVKLYNLSASHKYTYIGMCRISVKKDCIQIHMPKFLLNRGQTGEYKIVVSNRIVAMRNSKLCVLMLPDHERIEAGQLRKEILFQYE